MRRILKWVALGAAGILVVLIGLLLSLPLILDSGAVRAAALQHLARATGGQWRLDNLDLTWFPRPAIEARGVAFSIPGSAEGKVDRLSLTTALLPLLWGNVRLSRVALAAPDITVTIASSTAAATPSAPGTFTVSDLRAALARVTQPPGIDLRALDLIIERGRVALAVPGHSGLIFTDINAHATQRAGTFEIEVSSTADLSHRIEAKVSLDPQRFEGDIQLDAKAVDLGALLAVAGVEGDPQLKGLVSARARIKADGTPALRGTFAADMAALSIEGSAGKLELRGVAAAGEAEWTDSGLQLTGNEVRTAVPAVQGAARLTFSPDWNRQHLEVKLQPASLEAAKQLALPWTTGTPEVERYARMITAGELREVAATLQLDQIDDWQQAIQARGMLAGAAMQLEQPDLPLRDVSATLELAQGKLVADEVRAASGNTLIQSGHIELDFAAAQTTMSAHAQWRADLAEALAFTRKQLAAGERAKLDSLRLTGNAQGSVALSGTFDQLQVLAEAAQIRAQASLDQIPWPVNVTSAQARFDGSEVAVRGLGGSVGKSTFSRCGGRIVPSAAAKLRIDACDADLAVVELFDWVSKRFALPEAAKDLRVLAGRGLVQIRGLDGPLAEPGKWSGNASVTPMGLRLTHPVAPGPLRLDGGSVLVDLTSLQITRVKAEVLDAALLLSGGVTGLHAGTPRLDLQATGAVGKRILAWAWKHAGLHGVVSALEPFEARQARMRWPVDGGLEVGGDLVFAGKTAVTGDARIQPGLFDLRRLSVQDENSNARLSVSRRKETLEGSFMGTLSGRSLDRVWHAKQLPQTQMSGNLTYRVPLNEPRDFRANGSLRIVDFTSLGWWLTPMHLTIHRADVKATERTLRLDTSFSVREEKFDVSGTLSGTDQRYALDIDVKSDDVDVEQLLGSHEEQAQERPSEEQQSAAWDLPVEGTVRVALKALHRGYYRVAPLVAAAQIAPGHIDFTVTQAQLCGIGVAGGGRAEPKRMSLDVVLRARDIDPEPTLLCLTNERTALTGRFDADAHLTASGRYRKLPQLFKGPFHMVARDGHVDRMTGLAQVLNLVNASELLRGRRLGLSSEGFAYDRFVMRGTLDGAVIQFDEVVLDAQPFDLVGRGSINWVEQTVDMNVAVAPLQVANTIVKMLPLLGYVLGGGIYAVPVGVRGKLSDPQIVPVAPAAVAGTFFGMLERTLKTPFNLREALIPPAMQGSASAPPAMAPMTGAPPAKQ